MHETKEKENVSTRWESHQGSGQKVQLSDKRIGTWDSYE